MSIFCPKDQRKLRWWPFHDWVNTMYYPAGLGDGAGGCWAGHIIWECTVCHQKSSAGIWAAEETEGRGGKIWSWMRLAYPDELAEHGIQARSSTG